MAQTRHPHSGREDDGTPPSTDEIIAAADLAVQAIGEEFQAGNLAPGRDAPPPAPPEPSWASLIPAMIASQVDGLASLGRQQQGVLADLLRLHFSLAGPQSRLEAGSNFSRPLYPPTSANGRR